MIPYLRLILLHLWVACVAGAALIAALAMGYVSFTAFVWAGVIGLAIGVPGALLNWVYLRPNRARQIGWTWPITGWARLFFYLIGHAGERKASDYAARSLHSAKAW